MIEGYVIFLLGGWLVLSILIQFPGRFLRPLQRLDVFGLLPRWTFFAPNPISSDFYLLYRDRCGSTLSAFHEVSLYSNDRKLKCLFNPRARIKKGFYTLTRAILRNGNVVGESEVMTSISYLLLLNYLSRFPAASGVRRQFVILSARDLSGEYITRVVFTSGFHRIR